MNRSIKTCMILATAVLLFSTSAVFGQKVKVDVDTTANFSSYKTFGWNKEGQVARNPIVSKMIMDAVEAELTARGLTKTADNPDLKIAVAAAVGTDIQTVGPSWNINYITWGGYTNPAAMMNISTGTLLVDLVDTKKDIGVLRGVAKETLTRSPSADMTKDAKSVEKLIKKAVSKIFKKYPGGK